MSGAFRTYRYIKKLVNFRLFLKQKVVLASAPKVVFSRCKKLLIANQVFTMVKDGRLEIEEELKKACEEGESAIIELMNQLKECVILASQQYRVCLQKQIEITRTATNLGPLSEKWDELPAFRTLADALNEELNDYLTLFKTIGQMAYDQSIISYLSGNVGDVDNVAAKYKELEVLMLFECELNKQKEIELLNIKRESILFNADT